MRADDLGALGFVGEKMIHLLDRAVERNDGEAVVVHVEDEILAHHGQTDECDVSLRFHKSCWHRITTMGGGARNFSGTMALPKFDPASSAHVPVFSAGTDDQAAKRDQGTARLTSVKACGKLPL